MPENRSSEAAPFREYSPSHVAWRVDDDHHLAIAEEILDLWEHDVVPFQPRIRAEMRLNIVPSLLINGNVRLARFKLDQRLDRGGVHPILFENRQLLLTDLILPDTGYQGHLSVAEDSGCGNRDIPAFSSWDPVDFLDDHFFTSAAKSFDDAVDVPAEGACHNQVSRQTKSALPVRPGNAASSGSKFDFSSSTQPL